MGHQDPVRQLANAALPPLSACENLVDSDRDDQGISKRESQVHAEPERGLLFRTIVTVTRQNLFSEQSLHPILTTSPA